jgi:glycogen(starch) synthase
MRVLIISWEYPPYVVGGIGTHVAELVPCLGGMETEFGPIYIDVLTTRFSGGKLVEPINQYVTIYRVDMPVIDALDHYNSVVDSNRAFVEAAHALAEKNTYDIIHVHDWLTGEAGIAIKHELKQPLLITMHATERGRHQGYLPSYTSQQIDRLEGKSTYEAWSVIACSNYMLNELTRSFSLPIDKVRIVPNGINSVTADSYSAVELEQMRAKYAPNGEHLLFYVGRIVYEKGVQVLIRAMPRILLQHPNTRLIVAGKNSQTMYQLAYELAVEDKVDFVGFISNHQRDCFYQVVDAAVFPSLYEPFGIVALEAMTQNCNVIVSDTGGLREVVKHEVNGLTAYANDPTSIAWAVNRLFTSPDQAAIWRANALHDAQTNYNWNLVAEQTARVYEQVHRERLAANWE